ncbi:MAG TPA: IS110 family transposase [Candidatus Limnocylindria bacterium]|nr:IS110 family transposase [Candidatus Limnocylindria bacterium]
MSTVGIDIGAYRHVAAICREGERAADRAILRIDARRAGFSELDSWLAQQGPVSLVVMESSGHYWLPLASHLRRQGVPVALVNPLEAKYFAKSRLQRSKSDPADARTLAALGMRDRPTPREVLAGAELREASRFAMKLVEQQAEICQRIRRLIDLGFPELQDEYDDPTCTSALALLAAAPTARDVARKQVKTLAAARTRRGGRPVGEVRATRLHEAAKTSVAPLELADQISFQMRILLDEYSMLEGHIALAEKRLASLLDSDLSRRLRTIPGVGPAIAATLIAEIGDIFRFSDVDQLLAYAGVHPKEQSSGKKGASPETSWTMAKTGNAHLRTAAYRMAVVGLQHNPLIRDHYARKRAQGKSKMNALGHCMGKALAIVWGVWRSGRDFDPAGGRT